jgi:hypothetical protein
MKNEKDVVRKIHDRTSFIQKTMDWPWPVKAAEAVHTDPFIAVRAKIVFLPHVLVEEVPKNLQKQDGRKLSFSLETDQQLKFEGSAATYIPCLTDQIDQHVVRTSVPLSHPARTCSPYARYGFRQLVLVGASQNLSPLILERE